MTNSRKNGKPLTAEEKALFCSQIVMLLKAGIPLHDGMHTLSETYTGTGYEELFSQIDLTIRQTGSLADAVSEKGIFPDHIVRMIRIGEHAGILEEVLEALDWYYQREVQVRRAVKNAVLYPLILIVMMTVVIGILSIRVMPIFTQVYASLGVEASVSADAMIHFGSVIGQFVLSAVAGLLAMAIVLFVLLQTKQKDKVKGFLLKLFPRVKRIAIQMYVARFSVVLSKLLEGGFPMEEAITLIAGILPDQEFARKVTGIREELLKGESLAEAIAKAGMYKDIYSRMLKVAGMSGSMDKTIRRLGEIYDEEADEGIRKIVSLIEPAIVGVLAVIIGAILLAVMLPLASILSVIA